METENRNMLAVLNIAFGLLCIWLGGKLSVFIGAFLIGYGVLIYFRKLGLRSSSEYAKQRLKIRNNVIKASRESLPWTKSPVFICSMVIAICFLLSLTLMNRL